ncbi:MAG: hypothetical protein HC844_16150 [Tabrizicola sp.]|nr:hypothetical protein [Tabrizicola sp.]
MAIGLIADPSGHVGAFGCGPERGPVAAHATVAATGDKAVTVSLKAQNACGENGSCAEYLLETVLKCEELGIHDHFLWRLQELVTERMRSTK